MSENKTLERSSNDATTEWRVGPGAWISLVVVLLVFSGLLFKVEGMAWLGAFDFTTLGGAFGTMKTRKPTLSSVAAASALRPVSSLRCRWFQR